jgi:DNA-binding XRE family transcriptional regulator
MEEDFLPRQIQMLEMFANRVRHPLRELREKADVSQAQIAKLTGLSCTKISMAENYMGIPFTESEEKKIREAVKEITRARHTAVLNEAGGRR